MLALIFALLLQPSGEPTRAIHPDCPCGDHCVCTECNGQCFQAALQKSYDEKREVVIWIGMTPRKGLFSSKAVHFRAASYRGVTTPGWFTSQGNSDFYHRLLPQARYAPVYAPVRSSGQSC